jgi:hypothetical protein
VSGGFVTERAPEAFCSAARIQLSPADARVTSTTLSCAPLLLAACTRDNGKCFGAREMPSEVPGPAVLNRVADVGVILVFVPGPPTLPRAQQGLSCPGPDA